MSDYPAAAVGSDEPTVLGFPLNRIVAFLGPHISWLAGVGATWLVVHLHFLATFHVTQSRIASVIAQLGVFVTVTVVTWLGHQKWLEGFQVWAYGKHAAPLPVGANPQLAFNDATSQSGSENITAISPKPTVGRS